MTDIGYIASPEATHAFVMPSSPVEQHFLVIRSADSEKDLLILDISESGVSLQYDHADLPQLLKATEFFRTLKGGFHA